MSRAFVKESDGDEADDLPGRPQSRHINYVTPFGLVLLQQRIRELMEHKSQLSGCKDMISQQQLKQIMRDLRYFEERVERAVLVHAATQAGHQVHFGATVEVCDQHGLLERFTIVGEDEADAACGKISWVSPLAKALMGAEVGDLVIWPRPVGNKEVEVLSIHKDGAVC